MKTISYFNAQLAKENDGNGMDTMTEVMLKDVKKGDYFKLKPTDSATVWTKGEYDRSTKKHSCPKWDDCNHEKFLRGNQIVYTEFYF